jgi:hypothetical protein
LRIVNIFRIKVMPLVDVGIGLHNTENQLFALTSTFGLLGVVELFLDLLTLELASL